MIAWKQLGTSASAALVSGTRWTDGNVLLLVGEEAV